MSEREGKVCECCGYAYYVDEGCKNPACEMANPKQAALVKAKCEEREAYRRRFSSQRWDIAFGVKK